MRLVRWVGGVGILALVELEKDFRICSLPSASVSRVWGGGTGKMGRVGW